MTGDAKYIDDIHREGMLHGVAFRSELPRTRFLSYRLDPNFDWDGIVVADATDIVGKTSWPSLSMTSRPGGLDRPSPGRAGCPCRCGEPRASP